MSSIPPGMDSPPQEGAIASREPPCAVTRSAFAAPSVPFMTPTIEVRGLRKRYRTTLAVDGLSFTVRAGEVTGFVGPNGAGKSTTMRLILGLDAPDEGEALVNGRPYRSL